MSNIHKIAQLNWQLGTTEYSREGRAIEGKVPAVAVNTIDDGCCEVLVVSLGASQEMTGAVAQLVKTSPILYARLDQIERLSREADRSLVDLPAVLGDIAREALAEARGER
jgi:hypothetical protein